MLGCSRHVDTVVADPAGWRHDPWSGALDDGCVWGRGALDMKSQTAAEVVAACSLARAGWRPARGDLLVISVSDEEVDGTGAEWLSAERPDLVALRLPAQRGRRRVVRGRRRALLRRLASARRASSASRSRTDGAAGHASMPTIADNALLKLAPAAPGARRRAARAGTSPRPRAISCRSSASIGDPAAALAALAERAPDFAPDVEAMMRVTLAPTMVDASRADERDPGGGAAARGLPRAARAWSEPAVLRAGARGARRPTATGSSSPSAWSATRRRADRRCSTRSQRWVAAQRAGRALPADDLASATRTRAPSATRSPTAWPTASSRTGT